MVAYSTRAIPIVLSTILALLLIGGAYVLSGPNPFFTSRVNAKSAEELLKQYAAKDTDADSLPDWQEALYGTDPANAHSFSAELTDGEAAAQGLLTPQSLSAQAPTGDENISGPTAADDSLTARFSREFFARYFSTRGSAPPSEEEVLSFVLDAAAKLEAERAAAEAYAIDDLALSPETGNAALHAYAAATEEALRTNAVPADKQDLDYFAAAVESGDAESLAMLGELSEGYAAVASGLIEVPVPEEAAIAHLAMANALAGLGRATADLAALNTDPLRALLGIGSYQRNELEYARALARAHDAFAGGGVSLPRGERGAAFVESAAGAARVLSGGPQ